VLQRSNLAATRIENPGKLPICGLRPEAPGAK
jgi:hypothetical protein